MVKILTRVLSKLKVSNPMVNRSFTSGLFLMLLAREAYSSVTSVSSREWTDGDTVAMMHVLALPPNDSLSSLVSLLSLIKVYEYALLPAHKMNCSWAYISKLSTVYNLYGTWTECSTSAVMTRPRVNRLLFISPASLALPYSKQNYDLNRTVMPEEHILGC